MTITIPKDKIALSFAWEGPNARRGGSSRGGLDVGVVDLVFAGAKSEISALLPENIHPITPEKYSLTCRKYEKTEEGGRNLIKETQVDLLLVTAEQIRSLTLRAGFFEPGRPIGPRIMDPRTGEVTQQQTVRRTDSLVKVKIPEELEMGTKYRLVVTTTDALFLSARIEKEKRADGKMTGGQEFRGRMQKMGKALIEEGVKNLSLAQRGDVPSTQAEAFAHGMQGIIRAGQHMNPDIRVPLTKPLTSSSALDQLTVEELQARFAATFKLDKEFEAERIQASLSGDIPKMNSIIEAELENSQLLIQLNEALEKKGVKAEIPQTMGFQAVSRRSAEMHGKAIERIDENCKMQ